MSWILALLLLAAGGALGYLAARRFDASARRVAELNEALESAREEHAAYRREVSDHFTRTAHAVNTLTESYRTVHRHLSEGARHLCDDAAAETALAFDTSRLIGDAEALPPDREPEPDAPLPPSSPAAADELQAGPEGPPPPDRVDSDPEPAPDTTPAASAVPPRDYAEEATEESSSSTRH